jgi:hypothetical protein
MRAAAVAVAARRNEGRLGARCRNPGWLAPANAAPRA